MDIPLTKTDGEMGSIVNVCQCFGVLGEVLLSGH